MRPDFSLTTHFADYAVDSRRISRPRAFPAFGISNYDVASDALCWRAVFGSVRFAEYSGRAGFYHVKGEVRHVAFV